jgi:hypothetical protein
MHKNVETVIGRLATDAVLRRRFAADPRAVLAELVAQGLELTPIERDALASTHADALGALAASLDARLRKAARPAPSPEEKENER